MFDGKYKDIQVSTFTAYDSNGDGVEDAFFGNFLNAGNASMKGAEVEFDSATAQRELVRAERLRQLSRSQAGRRSSTRTTTTSSTRR